MSRVLLYSPVFSPDAVSTAYIMTDLALQLRRFGHEVTVISTTPHYNEDKGARARQPLTRRTLGLWYSSEIDGISVWHVTVPQKGNRMWKRVRDFVRFHLVSLVIGFFVIGKQNIVISTSPPLTSGAISWMIAARWGAPSVYKVAEIYPDFAIRQGVIRGSLMIGLMKALEQLVYRRNAMIVPIADQFRTIIKDRGVPDEKLRTIHDSVDVDLYTPMPRRSGFAVEHGLLDDFVVLYGGNIGIAQDWESVLMAASQVRDLPITFVIVGDGNRREWLAQQAAARGLSNIRVLGYQPKERMPDIIAACDLAMVPLTVAGANDGFPSKVYSNLACARPVLVSAIPGSGMAEFVAKGPFGRTVPPEDGEAFAAAVRAAYAARETLPEEGRRGRELIEREYSKEAIGRRYDTLIRELTLPKEAGVACQRSTLL